MSDHLVEEKIRETSMVDLVFGLLKDKGEPMQFHDMMKTVSEQKNFTEQEIDQYISQLYTDLNIDGRFVCVGRSTWGIRDWYSLEQATDSAVAGNIKDDELDDELEEDLYQDDDSDDFTHNVVDSEDEDYDDEVDLDEDVEDEDLEEDEY